MSRQLGKPWTAPPGTFVSAAEMEAELAAMDSQPASLADFLLARIAEDEAAARVAVGKRVDISATWSDVGVARHIDRWSSARVLAECESKRKLIALGEKDSYWEDVLRLLALPYADHPDYREEWKP